MLKLVLFHEEQLVYKYDFFIPITPFGGRLTPIVHFLPIISPHQLQLMVEICVIRV